MDGKRWILAGLLVLLTLVIAGSAAAAEFEGVEGVYILDSSETIEDDFYIGGEEVIINGTVKGDLFVGAGYVEINGTVEGDLFAAGGGVKVTGTVMDDARIAGAGVDISGTIGDDLFVAGGGQPGASFPMQISQSRTISQGVFINSGTQIGGDLFVGGGVGQVAGVVDGDAYIGMGGVNFGADVNGNVELASDGVTFSEGAAVDGRLRVSATTAPLVPSSLTESFEFNEIAPNEIEQPSLASRIWAWTWRTALTLIGFVGLTWLLLRYMPNLVKQPAAVLADAPGKSAAYGVVAALLLMFIPLASFVLVALVWAFFGVGPGLVLLLALFGVLSLVWIFSPLVTGYWIGRMFGLEALTSTLAGVAVLVILIQVPFIGWLIALLSFLFAFGAVLLMWTNQGGGEKAAVIQEKPIPAAGA